MNLLTSGLASHTETQKRLNGIKGFLPLLHATIEDQIKKSVNHVFALARFTILPNEAFYVNRKHKISTKKKLKLRQYLGVSLSIFNQKIKCVVSDKPGDRGTRSMEQG